MTTKHEDARKIVEHISAGYPERVLTVYLQPIMDMTNGRCLGAEALVRGLVEGKVIPPDRFIAELEQNSDICKVGVYVLQSALLFAKEHGLHQERHFMLSSNFSPVEINDRTTVEKIKKVAEACGYPVNKITIEITETKIPLSAQGRENARWLQQNGFVLAWDDISHPDDLNKNGHEFCSNVIKLDRSLLNKESLPLAKEIIQACKRNKLQLVAEGVEYLWQREWLLEQDVTTCQGYFYSPPVESRTFAQRYRYSSEETSH
ncbi:EAL domain-containing protein [Buttiauxella gaviniae]|uniref:EAL domain-containing protein n=1 Tax=Buttiauxella gaviniae TaxID=82990 RepID=A0ABV3NPV7_9ENTR